MKKFIEQIEESCITSVRKWLQSKCQILIKEHSVENLEIQSRNNRPIILAIFKSRTNGIFINMLDGF